MKKLSLARNFVPKLENLEDRTVPSGDVAALVLGKSLDVIGDNYNNSISIVALSPSSVVVSPTDASTTINGQSGPVVLSGIENSVFIKLGKGDNNLQISGVISGDDFWVSAGTGKNSIGLTNVLANKALDIAVGGGNDNSIYVNSSQAVDLYVRTAGNKDQVAVLNSKFGKNSSIISFGSQSTLSLANDSFGPGSYNSGFETAVTTDLPIAKNTRAIVSAGASTTINVLANDTALVGTLVPGSVTVVSDPTKGFATVNSNGTITYNSTGTTAGIDSFEYTVTDSHGNVSNAATVTVAIGQASNESPTVAIASTASSPTLDSPIPFTATFSQNVTGFSQNSIEVSNGSLTDFSEVSASQYSFEVKPAADGTVTVTIPANAAQNSNNLPNTAGSGTIYSLRTASGIQSTIPAYTGPGFITDSNGLSYETVQSGPAGGTAATSTSTVSVFYTGWLTNGTKFDSQTTTGSPATFDLNGGVIAGFQQGITGMVPGDVRVIFIPSALGYGASGSPPSIPANADLVFEVKLISVQ